MAQHTPHRLWSHDMIRARLNRRRLVRGAVAGGAGITVGSRFGGRSAFAQTPVPPQVNPTADEPEVQLPLTEETQTLRVLIPQNPTVEDYETNAFTQWLEEQTNVHIEWQTVPFEEADAALTLRLSSGDYPDIIMDFNPTPSVLQLYGSQGVFTPMNDLIEQHGTMTKLHWEEYPAARVASTATDGNVYSLPQINDCYHCTMSAKLWINQEWLDTLGLEMPQTTEAYAEVLRAFRDGDPNGNGEADEIPLSGSALTNGGIWHGSPDEFFMNSFIYHPGDADKLRLIQDAGQVIPIYAQDAWREGTKYLSSLHAEGLLSAEIFTNDRDQVRALGNGENGGAVLGSVPAGWFGEFTTYTAGEGGAWQAYTAMPPLEGPAGTRYSMHDTFQAPIVGNFIITDTCENPELAMQWADFLGRVEPTTRSIHGVKDTDWRWAYEGEIGIDGEQGIWHSITDIANVPTQNVHWSQDGPSYRSSDYRLSQVVNPETAAVDIEVILYNLTKERYEPYVPAEPMNLPPLYFNAEQAEQVATIMPQLESFVDETFAQAVTGQIDIEAEWENYLSNLEAIGLGTFVDIHQQVLDEMNANV